jgi:UDP-N-acetylglucosamine--N-acetylmuramyl-(pentapeptide) pyrophosphoryl-undecaprenol N-acetylglucosamine transferase
MDPCARPSLVAIACGGTGGHLFPGLAVAEELEAAGVAVQVLISHKDVDEQAVRGLPAEQVARLPAVALERGRWLAFARGLFKSVRVARRWFRERRPGAVLAMGGFTSLPPVLAGKRCGAATFLHEANAVPGRANRWLAHVVDEAFVHFPGAAERLWHQHVRVVGMPVRSRFQAGDPAAARLALGLRPDDPVLLVTGGSQGAVALNDIALRTMPALRLLHPRLQVLHLTGSRDFERVRQGYASQRTPALVRPFLTEMELALGAASVTLSRAGASFLAEAAAVRVPALLVPLPSAVDNHQFHNARALAEAGAARLLAQAEATSEKVLWELRALIEDGPVRTRIQEAQARWHLDDAAQRVARVVLEALGSLQASPEQGEAALASPAVEPSAPRSTA